MTGQKRETPEARPTRLEEVVRLQHDTITWLLEVVQSGYEAKAREAAS